MPRMTKPAFAMLAACALSAPALAVFTGIDLREDKGQIPPVELATIDPMGLGVRVINLYATFDGPGDPDAEHGTDSPNSVIGAFCDVGQSWAIDKSGSRNDSAFYYQDDFGSHVAPPAALVSIFPTVEWDTFVGFKRKQTPVGDDDITHLPSDFGWIDQDSDGEHDGLVDGWFAAADGRDIQRVAEFSSVSSAYEVFLAQLTIVGLDANASLGQLHPNGTDWEGDIFAGDLIIATQRPGGGAFFHDFRFVPIPAPATSITILPLLLTLSRRRRNA